MSNTELYIQRLLEANPLREPLLRSVIQSLQLPAGSCGLDAGCGIGLQSLLLAEAVGHGGQITGLDVLPELLSYASEIVAKAGRSDRIVFREGDVNHLPFDDDSFDWVWSADCVGYPAGELGQTLHELIRVVRPGGKIVLLGWTSQQFLPGYPLLEARLNGTCSGYLPYLKDKPPEQNFMRAPHDFQKAGLVDLKAQTFVRDIQAPFTSEERAALASLFEMLWGSPQPEVSPEDWLEYLRLCRPASPEFVLDLPDYYGFFTCTLFQGRIVNKETPHADNP
jgi:demethylmenaquinone methyltransferase/2-methoxy-6-polyprenyl-1,4-benzoquinol methylase